MIKDLLVLKCGFYYLKQTRVKWMKSCAFDLELHENVNQFPHEKMMQLLGADQRNMFIFFMCYFCFQMVVLTRQLKSFCAYVVVGTNQKVYVNLG